MGDRQTINVILTAADEDDRNRIYKLLEQTLNADLKTASDDTADSVKIEKSDKFDELGAFETAFLIGMGVGVPVTAGGIWVWWEKHNGKRVPAESDDGQAILKAVTPENKAPQKANDRE